MVIQSAGKINGATIMNSRKTSFMTTEAEWAMNLVRSREEKTMPQAIALELYKAYQAKRTSDPDLERKTIFKHLLWATFDGRMILDEEIDRMAAQATTLFELTIGVVQQLKPQFKDPALNATLKRELHRYFDLNMPDALK